MGSFGKVDTMPRSVTVDFFFLLTLYLGLHSHWSKVWEGVYHAECLFD